jgi:hypothetical protein
MIAPDLRRADNVAAGLTVSPSCLGHLVVSARQLDDHEGRSSSTVRIFAEIMVLRIRLSRLYRVTPTWNLT